MTEKWGHYEGIYNNPFNNSEIQPNECIMHKNLKDLYGEVSKFPSLLEFDNLLQHLSS